MAWVAMNKARVLQCNETGKLAIQTGPGQELIPLGGASANTELAKDFIITYDSKNDADIKNFTYDEFMSAYNKGLYPYVTYVHQGLVTGKPFYSRHSTRDVYFTEKDGVPSIRFEFDVDGGTIMYHLTVNDELIYVES